MMFIYIFTRIFLQRYEADRSVHSAVTFKHLRRRCGFCTRVPHFMNTKLPDLRICVCIECELMLVRRYAIKSMLFLCQEYKIQNLLRRKINRDPRSHAEIWTYIAVSRGARYYQGIMSACTLLINAPPQRWLTS